MKRVKRVLAWLLSFVLFFSMVTTSYAEETAEEDIEPDLEATEDASVPAPGKVTGLKAAPAGKNRVKLTWTAVSEAEGYLIYGKTAEGVYRYKGMTTSGAAFTDTKAVDSEWNFYWVFAYVKDDNGKMVPGGCEKYVYAKGVCPAVTNLKASSSQSGVTLTWDAVDTAEGYLIYGKTAQGSYGYKGMTTSGTKWTDTKASSEEYTFYWVFPYHNGAEDKMIVGGTAPYTYGKAQGYAEQVSNLKANSTTEYVQLTWTAAPSAEGYLIYRKIGNGQFQYLDMVTDPGFADTTASDTEYNFYRVYPYITVNENQVIGKSNSYVYGKRIKQTPPAEPYPAFNAGSITINPGSAGDGQVGHNAYAGIAGKDYTDEKVYTFNDYMSSISGLNWNPLKWNTSDESNILGYLTIGFYEFVLNENKTGWAVIPEMAADYPVDVTANYVGQYGIKQGESRKAWKIALNPDACWEDGTPINADSYIYSYQQQLDPAQQNYRASSLYDGEASIVGAKAYLYQGQVSYNDLKGSYAVADLTENADGTYSTPDGSQVYIGINIPLQWTDSSTLFNYVEEYGDQYFDLTNWETIKHLAGSAGIIPLTDENMELFLPVITGNPAWGETEEDFHHYLVAAESYPANASWDTVGIQKTGEYELTFIFEAPIDNPNYYVPYYLPMYLVKEDLYESLKIKESDMIYSTYGTSAQTTASYGPYRMASFVENQEILYVRNENFYGYKDDKHTGMWQADNIHIGMIQGHSSEILAFLNGEIDTVNLQESDMAAYGSSEYVRYTPQSYTTKITFNTDKTALTNRGTQVLSNRNFRKAFSLAVDRSAFASSFTAAGSAGYGLLNYMYVYDPFSGASYRDSDAAKAALCDLYGLTYGSGGDYATVDDAYDAINGYDIQKARELMATAYEQVTSDGTWNGTTPINLTISVYSSDDLYVNMVSFLNDALQSACQGTGFEGKVSIARKVDSDYYSSMYNGEADMIFSTWGGAAYSPFGTLYELYCDDGANQMEYGFDTNAVMVTLTINGKEFTYSLQTWAKWMDGNMSTILTSRDGSLTLNDFSSYDADSRCALFAKMEYVYLANYPCTPLYYRNSGSLISQKGDYAVKTYTDMVGFGGIRYYTFNYDDAAWADVAGSLSY